MNKTHMMFIGIFVLIIAGTLLLTLEKPTGEVVKELEKVDLAINTFPNSALVHIAQEKGYFNEQGLDVKYRGFPTGKLALDALIGGGADIATTADVPIALAGLADQKISTIATIEYSTDNIQVVARKDAGITQPTDLKDKTLATTKGGGPFFFTHQFLKKYDMTVDDVKLVHLNPTDMVTALIKGDIDAFIVFEPSPSIARKEMGDELVTFSPSDVYGETWNIVVMQSNEDEEMIISFLKALVQAEKYMKTHPEESLAIVSTYSGTDIALLPDILAKQNIGVVLNNLLPTYLDQEAIWAIKQGLSTSPKIPNYDNYIDSSYLKRIESSRVTI